MRWVVLAAWIVAAPASARADEPANPYLSDALAEKARLRYDRALELLDEAIRWGRNGPAEIARIYLLGGEMAGGVEDPSRAREYFERLLALRPDASLPAGASPKITEPFAAAKRAMADRALAVRHETEAGPTVVLIVDADPLRMVAGARVRYRADGGDETIVEGRGAGRIRVALPRAEGLDATVAAIDEYGNELARIDTVIAAPRPPDQLVPTPAPPVDTTSRPHPKWPYAAGLAVVFTSAGIYYGLDARDAQSEFDELREQSQTEPVDARALLDLETRGDRSALRANLSFAAAGITAALTTYLLIRHYRDTPTITPTASPQGATLTVQLAW